MEFINQAVTVLQTLVVALGAGLAVWGVADGLELHTGADEPLQLGKALESDRLSLLF